MTPECHIVWCPAPEEYCICYHLWVFFFLFNWLVEVRLGVTYILEDTSRVK